MCRILTSDLRFDFWETAQITGLFIFIQLSAWILGKITKKNLYFYKVFYHSVIVFFPDLHYPIKNEFKWACACLSREEQK